jgi:hypothetical protein
MTNLHPSSRISYNDACDNDNKQCLFMMEGEPLDIVCGADGHPRPALDVTLDRNGSQPTIMALASGIQPPALINDQFKSTVYEAYRIVGLTAADNGRNLTCHVDMKQIDKNLILSTTKRLYIECMHMHIIICQMASIQLTCLLIYSSSTNGSRKIEKNLFRYKSNSYH